MIRKISATYFGKYWVRYFMCVVLIYHRMSKGTWSCFYSRGSGFVNWVKSENWQVSMNLLWWFKPMSGWQIQRFKGSRLILAGVLPISSWKTSHQWLPKIWSQCSEDQTILTPTQTNLTTTVTVATLPVVSKHCYFSRVYHPLRFGSPLQG